MMREWGDLLQKYTELGGTLILEEVPAWVIDLTDGGGLREWEKPVGNTSPGTVQFGALSGVRFRYDPRGAVTKIRILQAHALAEGLGQPNEWMEISYKEGDSNYGYLAYPAAAQDATVLIEAEHEACPYDGVAYMRRGKINGVYPLVTVNQFGKGVVIRHYAHVSLPTTLGEERFQTLAANLAQYVRKLYNEHAKP